MDPDKDARLDERWRALNRAAGTGAPLDANGPNASIAADVTPATLSPSRQRLHRRLVEEWLDTLEGASDDGEALLFGGFPGAGKSTICAHHLGESRLASQVSYSVLDPDNFKLALLVAEPPLVPPDLTEHGLDPATMRLGELATLVHRESLLLTQLALERVAVRGLNVIVGTTLASYSRGLQLANLLLSYRTGILVVDVASDQAQRSIRDRWRHGILTGAGTDARFLPESVIDAQRDATGRTRALGVAERLVRDANAVGSEIWINSADAAGWDTRPVRWLPPS